MKTHILVTLLIVAHASATIDVQKLKQNVAEKLQTLEGKAANTLHQFIDSIDVEKVKKYDLLHIIPLVKTSQQLIQKKIESLPTIIQTGSDNLRFYYQKLHSLTGKDLILAFDAVPWPALRRSDAFDN